MAPARAQVRPVLGDHLPRGQAARGGAAVSSAWARSSAIATVSCCEGGSVVVEEAAVHARVKLPQETTSAWMACGISRDEVGNATING
jgi:hypothetical protein